MNRPYTAPAQRGLRAAALIGALLVPAAVPLPAQSCELKAAAPLTCVTVEFIRGLGAVAAAQDSADLSSKNPFGSADLLKRRMNAVLPIIQRLRPYCASKDGQTRLAGVGALAAFEAIFAVDSINSADVQDAERRHLTSEDIQHRLALRAERGDTVLKLLITAAVIALDAPLTLNDMEPPDWHRAMTAAQRDTIVAEIDRAFGPPPGRRRSMLTNLAEMMRANLLDKRWIYARWAT